MATVRVTLQDIRTGETRTQDMTGPTDALTNAKFRARVEGQYSYSTKVLGYEVLPSAAPAPSKATPRRDDNPECSALTAQQQAQASGLPALTGSDKQIAWANDIRGSLLRAMAAAGVDADKTAEVLAKTSAKWWIDARVRTASMAEALERQAARNKKLAAS